MPDRRDEGPDYRPELIICAYEVDESGWDLVEDLSGEVWNPIGARTVAVASGEPEALASALSSRLAERGCRGLLLVGRTRRSDAFRLQIRTENHTLDGGQRLDMLGPGMARSTAPVADILRAINEAGLVASASSECEGDVGSYLLYRTLSDLPDGMDTPAIGLLRAPEGQADAAVQRAVKAAAQAIARHLSPLPRSRAS